MLAEQWRRLDRWRSAVEPDRPGWHRHLAIAMVHGLEDAALGKTRLLRQLHRVEDGARRHARAADLRHRLLFGTLAGPAGDDLIDFGLMLDPGGGRVVARIADQILASDQLQQARPMLGIGA